MLFVFQRKYSSVSAADTSDQTSFEVWLELRCHFVGPEKIWARFWEQHRNYT